MLRTFSRESFEFGLASWRWLGINGKTPRFTTCFGDVFLESLEGWWFLDAVEGTLELRWSTAVDMYAELETPEGQATFLLADLVQEATHRGHRLAADEVFTFNPHPASGGDMSIDTVVSARFALAMNWAGQLHEQLRAGNRHTVPDAVGAGTVDHLTDAWASAWQEGTGYADGTGYGGAHPLDPARQYERYAPPADTYGTSSQPVVMDGAYAAGAYPAMPTGRHATIPPAQDDASHRAPAHETDPYATYPADPYAQHDGWAGQAPAVTATGAYATVPAPVGYYDAPAAPSEPAVAETGALPAWDDLWRRR
ncbi:hypothetical protein [Antribacter gilvus]|uniref:hypothetical protein n=1 Tax=Antribacter gilvus TaxID=2304675 RepID=UPI000F7884CF|nr:hypothetical protein [Antribacter gilvus]